MNFREIVKKRTGESIKIAVIDTGINLFHPAIKDFENVINTEIVEQRFNRIDMIGHGTAVSYCIHKIAKDAELICINVFGDQQEIDTLKLSEALDYVYNNIDCDIINISCGVVCAENHVILNEICKKIIDSGKIIVSAFDNFGAVSYPAAFPEVIGVDMSQKCTSIYDFEYIEGEAINIRGRGANQKVPWTDSEYKIVVGSSFSSGYMAGIIALLMEEGIRDKKAIMNELKRNAIMVHQIQEYEEPICSYRLKRVVLVPFNKEMHSLVAFSEESEFVIEGIYSYKYTGQVGRSCSEILNRRLLTDYIVCNFEKLDWENEFDTVIIGHLDELSSITHRNLKKEIIEKCLEYKKNIFSLDASEIDDSVIRKFTNAKLNLYYPKFTYKNLPKGMFGKMHVISTPILGFFGTSSIQGKFTLQLEIKRRLRENGFLVGHLSTEATGQLLGAEYSFPFGYASTVDVKGIDAVIGINSLLHRIEYDSMKDIILVGSQSLSVQNSSGNIMYYPCCQTELLFAIDADAIILNVNYTDEDEYIERTIKFLESANNSKVIALVLFPCRRKDVYAYLNDEMQPIQNNELIKKKKDLENTFSLSVYILGDDNEIDSLYEDIISYFAS